jgi:Flp pilus assembly protein TadG
MKLAWPWKCIRRAEQGVPSHRLPFLRHEGATTAVEFGMVVLPFFMVLMVMINSALLLLAGQVLQTAATSAARLVLTGQAQNANYTSSQFKSTVCASLTAMFNCTSNLYIDIESFSSFTSISLPAATNSNGTLNTAGYNYSPGNPGDIVVVRLIYQWPIIASGLVGNIFNPVAPNNSTLIATVAFRNEPYTPST